MGWLLYRIKESRGFVARRVVYEAYYIALVVYGQVAEINGRILTPDMMYIEKPKEV